MGSVNHSMFSEFCAFRITSHEYIKSKLVIVVAEWIDSKGFILGVISLAHKSHNGKLISLKCQSVENVFSF